LVSLIQVLLGLVLDSAHDSMVPDLIVLFLLLLDSFLLLLQLLPLVCLLRASAALEVTVVEDSVVDQSLEDPELGYYQLGNGTFAAEASTAVIASQAAWGRQLAEEKKPKRKYCNTSAYGLKGDYAYEACGAFCKQAKAVNHCKFCKCRACEFCASIGSSSTPLKKLLKHAKKEKATPTAAGSAAGSRKLPGGLKKGKGKGKGLKRQLKQRKQD